MSDTQTTAKNQITEMINVLQGQRNSALDALVNTTVSFNLSQEQLEASKKNHAAVVEQVQALSLQLVNTNSLFDAFKENYNQLEQAHKTLQAAHDELSENYEALLAKTKKSPRKR
jgi:chromosome segregation ATPase